LTELSAKSHFHKQNNNNNNNKATPLSVYRSKYGGAENARLENTELENAAPNCRDGKRETGKGEIELQDGKTRDWKTRERIGYGKPIKPKQPTHFRMLI